VNETFLQAVSAPEELTKGRVWRHRRKDGTVFLAEVRSHRIELEGRPARLVLALDVTERHRAEERFRELAETIEEVFWITDARRTRVIYVSPAYERIWGRSRQSLYADPGSWIDSVVPEDRERVRLATTTWHWSRQNVEEYRVLRPDGEVRWIRDLAYPVRDASGEVERVLGVARDISSERSLEAQLRLSQKMEALGQLAGGVAHDFNNLLGVILMQIEALLRDPGEAAGVREGLEEIRAAAERAAGVTRQLLQFGRGQRLQRRDVDINEVVKGISPLLQRLLGEDVQLELELHSGALFTRVDPGLLDQVLMNLAVNARDAMRGSGRLRISTGTAELVGPASDSEAGRQPAVRVRVTDTGEGIRPDILPRIFEPFFTTKAPGKGTGLGLATVLGIVRQHGGSVLVESSPGEGTVFDVLLPVASPGDEASVLPEPAPLPSRGSETVLLVEDESALRRLARKVLEGAGYRVLEAEDGPEALRVLGQSGPADLLLTDMSLPGGMSGSDLARAVQDRHPELRVILTSGYDMRATGSPSTLDPRWQFLLKPVRSRDLLAAMRRSLDGSPPSDRGSGE
jgi:PAS domain S-box-containing protein